ncbi:hypothetical protein F4810DRAFT_94817 [Camillea tinctor]|nr:hypothetical protein F4810DRAFT_94817 [Camillea tinctor]
MSSSLSGRDSYNGTINIRNCGEQKKQNIAGNYLSLRKNPIFSLIIFFSVSFLYYIEIVHGLFPHPPPPFSSPISTHAADNLMRVSLYHLFSLGRCPFRLHGATCVCLPPYFSLGAWPADRAVAFFSSSTYAQDHKCRYAYVYSYSYVIIRSPSHVNSRVGSDRIMLVNHCHPPKTPDVVPHSPLPPLYLPIRLAVPLILPPVVA